MAPRWYQHGKLTACRTGAQPATPDERGAFSGWRATIAGRPVASYRPQVALGGSCAGLGQARVSAVGPAWPARIAQPRLNLAVLVSPSSVLGSAVRTKDPSLCGLLQVLRNPRSVLRRPAQRNRRRSGVALLTVAHPVGPGDLQHLRTARRAGSTRPRFALRQAVLRTFPVASPQCWPQPAGDQAHDRPEAEMFEMRCRDRVSQRALLHDLRCGKG